MAETRRLTFVFYEPSGWTDWVGHAVCLATRSRYSHVAVAYRDPRHGEVLYEALRDGVIDRLGADAMARALASSVCLPYEVPTADLERAVAWADSQVGHCYDWWQLLPVWLSTVTPLPPLDGPDICSTFAAEFGLRAGVFTGDPLKQTPGSLARALGVQVPATTVLATGTYSGTVYSDTLTVTDTITAGTFWLTPGGDWTDPSQVVTVTAQWSLDGTNWMNLASWTMYGPFGEVGQCGWDGMQQPPPVGCQVRLLLNLTGSVTLSIDAQLGEANASI